MRRQAPPLAEIKSAFSEFLVEESKVLPPRGLPTGIPDFDEKLLWKGLPKGEISLFCGEAGCGLTSLWLRAVSRLQVEERWAAWMNSEWSLYPQSGQQIRWDRLMVLEQPDNAASFFWVLQEMIASQLFDSIGCHLGENALKRHQLVKLKTLARAYQVALVFFSTKPLPMNPLYSLILEAEKDQLVIRRALHRLCPQQIPGVLSHARSLPAVLQRSRLQLG